MRFAVALIAAALGGQAEAATVEDFGFAFVFHNGAAITRSYGTVLFTRSDDPNLYQPSIPFTVNWLPGSEPAHGSLTAAYDGLGGFSLGDGNGFGFAFNPIGNGKYVGNMNYVDPSGPYGYVFSYKQHVVPGTTPASLSSPVPEPAPWALLITGFGLAGATLRRKREGLYV